MKTEAIIAIDQGTTSSRTILFTAKSGTIIYQAQQEFKQYYPNDGWVEHDPEDIWQTVYSTLCQVIEYASSHQIVILGIGITNQRETTLVWDKTTGKPIYNAIVWQDRRTADFCQQLQHHQDYVQKNTGLLLDPYFSSSKIHWILQNVDGAKDKANAGQLAFGTVDTFLIYRLTQGKQLVTDVTNASRTQLYNIVNQQWDATMLDIYNTPKAMLPEVLDCAADFGTAVIGNNKIPILGVAGDQQAATIGQCCFDAGSVKSTYGTGCFLLINSGNKIQYSKHQLLSTIAYRIKGQTTYALEGSIFVAGAAVQWLRDSLQIIDNAAETEQLCQTLTSNHGVYLVPAFSGLGAPHWDANARAAIYGMTRGTNRANLVRAAIESVCYQTYDLLQAVKTDGCQIQDLKVDGGMVANNWMLSFLADILNCPIQRPTILETTALGVASLAALQLGIFSNLADMKTNWQLNKQFEPSLNGNERQTLISNWHRALQSTLNY